MAKKRTQQAEGNGTTAVETPVSDVNGNGQVEQAPEAANNGNANGNGQKPVHVVSVLVQKDTYIQGSIWERVVQAAGGTFTTHEVSIRKRWKNAAGEWQSLHSFRASELYALEYVCRKAEEWILDKRSEGCPF